MTSKHHRADPHQLDRRAARRSTPRRCRSAPLTPALIDTQPRTRDRDQARCDRLDAAVDRELARLGEHVAERRAHPTPDLRAPRRVLSQPRRQLLTQTPRTAPNATGATARRAPLPHGGDARNGGGTPGSSRARRAQRRSTRSCGKQKPSSLKAIHRHFSRRRPQNISRGYHSRSGGGLSRWPTHGRRTRSRRSDHRRRRAARKKPCASQPSRLSHAITPRAASCAARILTNRSTQNRYRLPGTSTALDASGSASERWSRHRDRPPVSFGVDVNACAYRPASADLATRGRRIAGGRAGSAAAGRGGWWCVRVGLGGSCGR